MSPWARASELERLLACPGSAVLPRDTARRDFVHEAADWGRMVHHWKATGAIEAQPGRKNHERLLRERIEASGINRYVVWPSWEHEIGVAVDCATDATAVFRGTPEGIDAWKAARPESWITGTCDGWSVMDGYLVVDDLKTGRNPPEPDCAQMLLYATALGDWEARGLRERGKVLLRITHWPRYPRDGVPEFHTKFVTDDDMLAFRRECRAGYERYLEAKAAYVPGVPPSIISALDTGDHCTYCESRGICPAFIGNQETSE